MSKRAHKGTPLWAMWLIVVCTFLIAAGQTLMKLRVTHAATTGATWAALFIDPLLLLAFFLYAVAAVLMVLALKHGELSVLYPIVSLGFIWVTLTSIILLNEQLTMLDLGGIVCIMAGVSVIGHKGRNGGRR